MSPEDFKKSLKKDNCRPKRWKFRQNYKAYLQPKIALWFWSITINITILRNANVACLCSLFKPMSHVELISKKLHCCMSLNLLKFCRMLIRSMTHVKFKRWRYVVLLILGVKGEDSQENHNIFLAVHSQSLRPDVTGGGAAVCHVTLLGNLITSLSWEHLSPLSQHMSPPYSTQNMSPSLWWESGDVEQFVFTLTAHVVFLKLRNMSPNL